MSPSSWSRRKVVHALGIGAVLSPAILRSGQAGAQVNKSGAGGLAPPSNGSFLVPLIRKLELDKKNGLDFDINLYSDPSTLYSDLAASRTSHIFGAIYNCANFYVGGVPQSQQTTFLIVTHSIDEAIFLANRILVFGAPARLMAEIAVPSQAWEDRAVSDRIKNEVRSLIVAGARPG
jgi:hypothetical protein